MSIIKKLYYQRAALVRNVVYTTTEHIDSNGTVQAYTQTKTVTVYAHGKTRTVSVTESARRTEFINGRPSRDLIETRERNEKSLKSFEKPLDTTPSNCNNTPMETTGET